MRRHRQNQGILYIIVTIVLFIFIVGFVAFTAYAIMNPIDDVMAPLAESYHTDIWPLHDTLGYALTFMANFWLYLFALAFFALAIWVYMYSQHRGQPY